MGRKCLKAGGLFVINALSIVYQLQLLANVRYLKKEMQTKNSWAASL